MVTVNRHDLDFILAQIKIAEAHAAGTPLTELVVDPHLPFGLRTVNGTYNNLVQDRELWGSADQPMPRLLEPNWITADDNPRIPGTQITSYQQLSGSVYDSDPRVISNLIADQSLANIAGVSAALLRFSGLPASAIVTTAQTIVDSYKIYIDLVNAPAPDQTAIDAARDDVDALLTANNIAVDPSPDGELNIRIPDVSPDEGLTAPFNSWMTLFGQFFDHGLDLVSKGGSGTVYIPLQPDDPLYVPGSPTNFMVLTRATNLPGADGILGTADDIRENVNKTTPWVDQNQTYTSHASHQVFLREYKMVENPAYDGSDATVPQFIPVPTGNLLEGAHHGMATWADVKAQALAKLGIELDDFDVHGVPLLATDEYGNLKLDAMGRVQMIRDVNGVPTAVPTSYLAPSRTVDALLGDSILTGHAFLEDIAHEANPTSYDLDFDPTNGSTGNMVADDDDAIGLSADAFETVVIRGQTFVIQVKYDDELLDKHYMAGDGRANENFGLTAVHHIFHSEHNRQAAEMKQTILATGDLAFINEWLATDLPAGTDLATIDPASLDWDGARLFQSARFATEMQYQHMVFEEFGRRVHPAIDAFVFNSITDINPAIVAEFAHVVYRFGHSMLTENVHAISFDGTPVSKDLIDAFLDPVAFENLATTDDEAAGAVIRGMMRETGNAIDEFVTSALRNNLVGLPLDLAALNIARGRDTGIPSLQTARQTFWEASGSDWLKPYTSWADFAANIKNPASIINFIAAYGTHPDLLVRVPAPTPTNPAATRELNVEERRDVAMKLVLGGDGAPADRLDFLNATGAYAAGLDPALGGLNNVDFWIGGLAEKIMPFGGMLGSSFAFVFEVTMENLQNNDRFYYLTRTQGLNMLNELENNSFASIIMKNTDFGLGGSHLPGEIFGNVDHILEVDTRYQFETDPVDETFDPFLSGLGRDKVEREVGVLQTVGSRQYDNRLQFTGGEHVVLGGTNTGAAGNVVFGGRDILIGDVGDDTAWGDGGDDLIVGGAGVNHLHGGAGNDIILDGGDVSFLHGDDGDDVIHSGAGAAELIFGGDGNDVLIMGEDDAKHATAGEGNDFILGGAGADLLSGNEGDDWIEGKGGFDVISGDNSELFFNSTIIGHDIMFAGDNETDFDAESGDDIMVMGESVIRAEGMFGFDWVTYKDVRVAADLDLNRKIFATDQQDILRNRFDRVEGASGFDQNDQIWGDDRTGADLDPAVTLGQNETTMAGHFLTQEGIDRIAGLRDLLGDYVNMDDAFFAKGNILLGGGGADVIMGRGGDDFIDGDHWLNVRIEILGTRPDGVPASIDSLSEIMPHLLTGAIRPDQLKMVREVVDGDATNDAVDTAKFWDIQANYQITRLADGTVIVTHLTESDPADLGLTEAEAARLFNEGTDTLRNIERLEFADSDLLVDDIIVDNPATGTVTISDTTPTNGQPLTVNFSIFDADVFDLVDGVPVPIENGMAIDIQWQVNHDGTWTDIDGATNATFTPDGDIGVEQLRVRITTTDFNTNQTILYSAPTAPVGIVVDGTLVGDELDGSIGADIINGLAGADTINGLAGEDTIAGGAQNDLIDAGADDDTISWSVTEPVLGVVQTDGTDTVNGGTEGAVGDTFVVNGNSSSEQFDIWTAATYAGAVPAGTEIIVTRTVAGSTQVVAFLSEIEEIVINGGLGTNTFTIHGDFDPTNLAMNTITINGEAGDDTVDISALESAHRIVFRTKGGNDTIIGTLRAQDVIEIPAGVDPAAFTAEDNGDGTVTLSDGDRSITFTGSTSDLPTLVAEGSDGPGDGGNEGEDPGDDNGNDGEETEGEDNSSGSGGGTGSGSGTGAGDGTGAGNGTGSGVGTGGGSGGGSVVPPVPTVVDGVVLMPGSTAGVQVGDAGDDVIVGGEQGDALLGKGGHDIMLGNGGNDVGLGGSGADTIEGGAGRDVLLGGDGDDVIIGQSGDGADMIFGGAGSDTLDLSALTEGSVIDLGAYTAIGTVRTAGVTDHLIGVENAIGGTGADVIKASLSINVLTGGDGDDVFVFVSAGTADGDVITDFRPGDRIDLSGIDAMVGVNGNQAFTLAEAGTTAAGSLVIREVATEHGVDTIIDGFTDADADADFSITLRGAHNLDTSSFNL